MLMTCSNIYKQLVMNYMSINEPLKTLNSGIYDKSKLTQDSLYNPKKLRPWQYYLLTNLNEKMLNSKKNLLGFYKQYF